MSWSKGYGSSADFHNEAKRVEDRASLKNDREQGQYDAAMNAAERMLAAGALGDGPFEISVSVSGHANATPGAGDSAGCYVSRK
jgi:hypothetical protein